MKIELVQKVKMYKKFLVLNALKITGGNKSEAAKILGVHRNTVIQTLKAKVRYE